jgi:WD40 repeat protein
MESLSQLLSPVDDLEFLCEEHGIPCLGLCSNYLCKTKTKLLCMKCIKSGNTCITKENHELITISEMLLRFLKTKNETKSNEIQKIKTMNQIISDYDKEELTDLLTQFKSIKNVKSIKLIEQRLFTYINCFIELFKAHNNKRLMKLKLRSKSSPKNDKDIDCLLKIRIPALDKTQLNKKHGLNDIIKQGFKLSTPKNFANSIKLLNNTTKLKEISNELNKKIYLNNVYSNMSNINDKKKNLEKKIDSILAELESKFDEKMKQIEESLILPKEKPSLYIAPNTSFLRFKSDPQNLQLQADICDTAQKINSIDKVFCAFTSFTKESLIIWSTYLYCINIFDINKNKIVNIIRNAHTNVIYSCRHCPDKNNKIDYIITSSSDRSVKVWNLNTLSCALTLSNTHSSIYIYSVTILFEEGTNNKYIITSAPNDFIKVWDFFGISLYKFGQSDENHYFIDTYYDNKNKKYYIINGNSNDVKSYYFKEGDLFQRYKAIPQSWHMSAIIYEYQEQIILIESDGNGYIRMWDFHTAVLIKSISTSSFINLRGICLWNEKYLFVGANDHQIKLIDINEGKVIKYFKEHSSAVCTLEKVKTDKYGECLISQGLDGKIKMWRIMK